MIVPVARVAVAAMAATLAFNTGRNVYETVQISRQSMTTRVGPVIGSNEGSYNVILNDTSASDLCIPASITELESLSRKQILQLYLDHCVAPTDLSVIEGEWHGKLLNNNGLTRVTRFITNRLFGKGRRWNGKSFSIGRNASSESNNVGWNRFEAFSQFRTNTKFNPKKDLPASLTVVLKTEKEHCFDYDFGDSRLSPHGPCVSIDYSHYQRSFSLWKSMADELRVLPKAGKTLSQPFHEVKTADCEVLLGIGYMAWSGGILNCSPFYLYRRI